MPKEIRHYKAQVRCENCGMGGPNWRHGHEIEIPRGVTVDKHPCPECGCKTLVRSR